MKNGVSYIPVTMDELMNRFVLNLHRKEAIETFYDRKKILVKQDYNQLRESQVIAGVNDSMGCI